MQSKDYVPGVSGWKIDTTTGEFEMSSPSCTVTGICPEAKYAGKRSNQDRSFVIVDGVTYIRQAEVDTPKFVIRVEGNDAKRFVSGFGLGVTETPAPKPRSADEVLSEIVGTLKKTQLGSQVIVDAKFFEGAAAKQAASQREIAARIDSIETRLSIHSDLQKVIQDTLKPGGLIHEALRKS